MIRVGMMVEIVDHSNFKTGRQFIGCVGEVLGPSLFNHDSWRISGAETDLSDGRLIAFTSRSLREIKPPRTSKDVTESQGKYLPTFDDVIRECNKPVKELV